MNEAVCPGLKQSPGDCSGFLLTVCSTPSVEALNSFFLFISHLVCEQTVGLNGFCQPFLCTGHMCDSVTCVVVYSGPFPLYCV